MPQIAGDIAVASNGDVLFADARRGVIHRFAMAALNEPVRVTATVMIPTIARSCPPIGASIRPRRWPSDLTAILYVADARSNRVSRIGRLWRDRDACRVGRGHIRR